MIDRELINTRLKKVEEFAEEHGYSSYATFHSLEGGEPVISSKTYFKMLLGVTIFLDYDFSNDEFKLSRTIKMINCSIGPFSIPNNLFLKWEYDLACLSLSLGD